MNAYDKSYLEKARISLGRMLDYAVHDLKYDLSKFWEMFLRSSVSKRFEMGEVSIIAGRSGVELALMICEHDKEYTKPRFRDDKSKEYWLGWALAYFQWKNSIPFSKITNVIQIKDIRKMYNPYHEMDIRQFCDTLSQMYVLRKGYTNLKQKRLEAGLSQSQLANLTNIPVRTIQQYEQGQKNINRAGAEYLMAFSRALYCDPVLLLEPNLSETSF